MTGKKLPPPSAWRLNLPGSTTADLSRDGSRRFKSSKDLRSGLGRAPPCPPADSPRPLSRLWHIADGVILWMDDVETAKEVRRWLIIKKMRMTNHATKAFKVRIETGRGIILEPILSHRVDAGLKSCEERRVEEWA